MTGEADAEGLAADAAAAIALVEGWESAGERLTVDGRQIWWRHVRAASPNSDNPPLLVLHGFPTCSFDWRGVLAALSADREVVLLDFAGFGLSDKPDYRYGLRTYADEAAAVIAHFGLDHVDLLTHDMGDSVGGELLARSLEGTLGFTVGRRVLTNGSIYIEMAELTDGQQMLLGLPDERIDAVGADGGAAFRSGVAATFSPAGRATVDDVELDAVTALAVRQRGLSLLPRTIRYIEDRRAEQPRFTGAIETHPSPVGLVWGELDPVAVHAMAEHFVTKRTDAPLITLDGVGHYPMVEAPARFAAAVLELLDRLDQAD
ncbi:MAG: alpha/beta fold hydrolase [Acidimicrobiales bacterium]